MHLLFISACIAFFYKINEVSGSDWCYESQDPCTSHCHGPDIWQKTNDAKACAGRSQSPINIVTKKTKLDERLTPFKFTGYNTVFTSDIVNNGHSVKVGVASSATISGGQLETTYKAVQFHLHWGSEGGPGSEHTVDGEQYPMELHIVHMKQSHSSLHEALGDKTGVAVLGFFYEESSSDNRKYEPIINSLKEITQTSTNTTISLSLNFLIPPVKNMTNYYRYNGSLTTPGCAESVVWTVFEHPIPLSRAQLKAFSKLKFSDGKPMVRTFRPVQPLNKRIVYYSASNTVLASVALLVVSVAVAIRLSWPN
ncbi:hypothetical protein AAFF_G00127270 [Aldrovandia affinis]|uniref:Carbonic anhydrase n=1 Tax=Aldrovandia affinis TaxID=143900 RepID=A0AAD7WWP8_9TELE|nr:hypothetical protein AAFF_G00127270 [Aldrovandia affinis]